MTAPARRADTQQSFMIRVPHAELTGTASVRCFKATRPMKVIACSYLNPTGLAQDTTNTFAGVVQKATTTFATLFATDSDLAGTNTLVADTFTDGVMDADSLLSTFDVGDICTLVLTEGGTATLPEGFLQLECRYLTA